MLQTRKRIMKILDKKNMILMNTINSRRSVPQPT